MALLYSDESRGKAISPCPFLYTSGWSAHGYIQQADPIREGECSAQVVPWPYSADLAGIAFDQANLWGIRPYAALPSGDASVGLLITVPKTLPAGYTAQMLRCRGAVQIYEQRIVESSGSYGSDEAVDGGNYVDGDFFYNSYQMRTARGTFPTPAKAEYAIWRPKNANDIYVGINPDTNGAIWSTSGGKFTYAEGIFGVLHGGYRGAKITVRLKTVYPTIASGGSGNFHITIGCDPNLLSVGASPATTLYTTSFDILSMTADGSSGGFFYFKTDLTLPAGLVPTLGKSEYFTMLFGPDQTFTGGVFNCLSRFGPRTDIPLWFPVTYGNTCVKGGIPNGAY